MNNKMESKHTPTPYSIKGDVTGENFKLVTTGAFGATRKIIATIHTWTKAGNIGNISKRQAKANAAFIVKACNNQERLINALEAIKARINGDWDNPTLVKLGPLGLIQQDVLLIAEKALNESE